MKYKMKTLIVVGLCVCSLWGCLQAQNIPAPQRLRENLWAMVSASSQQMPLAKLREKADNGDAAAQCMMGNRYFLGFEVEQNHQKALEWYRRAAEQGNALAAYQIAGFYVRGDVVDQNNEKAVEYYRKAAMADNADAQWELARCYSTGYGVGQDRQLACTWYLIAGGNGNRAALDEGNAILSQMTPQDKKFVEERVRRTRQEIVAQRVKVATDAGQDQGM